jgi:DNA-binding HxlR family transcriptional regulator
MLTNQLRELECDGLIRRKVFAEVPPKAEYSLTSVGKTLVPVLQSLCDWGKIRMMLTPSITGRTGNTMVSELTVERRTSDTK